MFVEMVGSSPSVPFIAIAFGGLVVAGLVLIVTVAMLSRRGKWAELNPRQKTFVTIFLMMATFVLWGSSTGRGGPEPGGGTLGYTHGGLLHYVSATSYQPNVRDPWSHDLSVRPLSLLGTILLTAVVIGAVFGVPLWTVRAPNNPSHGSGDIEKNQMETPPSRPRDR